MNNMALQDNLDKKVQEAKKLGYSDTQIKRYLESKGIDPVKYVQAPITEQIKSDWTDRVERGADAVMKASTGEQSPLSAAVQTVGQGAAFIGDIGGRIISKIPGVSSLMQGTGEAVSENPKIQEVLRQYETFKQSNPELAANLEGAVNIASILPIGRGVSALGDTAASAAVRATDVAVDGVNTAIKTGTQGVKSSVSDIVSPSAIMQRVARIPAQKQAKFKELAGGESVGEYLVNRGIYGDVDGITQQLYKRFEQSKNTADKALASLPGTYKPTPIGTALDDLFARETRVSTKGALSRDFKRVRELKNKYNSDGLTMSEVNEVKRIYERNIKVDYIRENKPESLARATSLDTAIRSWQVNKAKELGLQNLPQINKETQLAKQLMDDLGTAYAAQAGNNAITLTDWIMLSGGDPTAAAAFLAKKTVSSKPILSAIAKRLNGGATQTRPFPIKSDLNFIESYGDWIKSIEGQKIPQSLPRQ